MKTGAACGPNHQHTNYLLPRVTRSRSHITIRNRISPLWGAFPGLEVRVQRRPCLNQYIYQQFASNGATQTTTATVLHHQGADLSATPEADRRGGGRPREEQSNQPHDKRRLVVGGGEVGGAAAWISCHRGSSLSVRAPGERQTRRGKPQRDVSRARLLSQKHKHLFWRGGPPPRSIPQK